MIKKEGQPVGLLIKNRWFWTFFDDLNGPSIRFVLYSKHLKNCNFLIQKQCLYHCTKLSFIFSSKSSSRKNLVSQKKWSDQFDKINEQQHEIEEQVNVLAIQKERYSLQKNILQVVLILFIITICLTIYSIFSIRLIRRKNRQLEITNEKVTTQRNQIKKIANEAKESNEARMNFFTGISHEFKTPITLIQSSIESIAENITFLGYLKIYGIKLEKNNSHHDENQFL
mgnify:CR=1 FL=1